MTDLGPAVHDQHVPRPDAATPFLADADRRFDRIVQRPVMSILGDDPVGNHALRFDGADDDALNQVQAQAQPGFRVGSGEGSLLLDLLGRVPAALATGRGHEASHGQHRHRQPDDRFHGPSLHSYHEKKMPTRGLGDPAV